MAKLSSETKSVLKRFGRAAVCGIIGIVASTQTHNPAFLIVAPALQALGKFLRTKWGMTQVPI